MPTRTNISQSHKISLRLLDSCRSISRRRRRRHRYLVQPLPAPFEKFRSQLRRLAISPAAKPPPMSAAVCDSWMALQPFIHDRKLKVGVSNATVDRALEVVRRILNVAHPDWRWLKGVPKIRMLKEPRRHVRFLRREEADRLIQALPEHMKPIVEFALSTGCRAGEILGLEWSRVDLTRKVAWLDHGTTKSGDGRGIPLNADAVAALEATRGEHPRWCFTFAGKRIQQSSTAWDKAKQRAASRTSASTTRGTPGPRGTCRAALRCWS
jgi:integrase